MRTFIALVWFAAISATWATACGSDDSSSAKGTGGGSSKGGSAGDASAGKGGTDGSGTGGSTGGSGGSAGGGADGGPTSACDEMGPRASFAPEYDILVKPTDDAVAVVGAAAENARIAFEAGTHRLTQPIVAKAGQAIYGLPGAILSGAVPLTGWTASGSLWSVGGQTHEKKQDPHPCKADRPLCNLDNDVFYDTTRLEPVASAGEVGPGKYFFDDASDTIYIGDDPNGHQVEMSITEAAFVGNGAGVRLENLVVERFAAPGQESVIAPSDGWVIEHVEIRENHGYGLWCTTTTNLRSSYLHHNGQFAIGGAGENIVVEDSHLAFNNTAGYDPFWGAGGTKWVWTTNLLVKDNCSHDNDGPGFWTDINNVDTRYEGNIAKDNTRPGIFHEISYAAVITGNTCLRNGLNNPVWVIENSGILVYNSPDVEIFGNVLEDNGIFGVQDPRTNGDLGPWEVSNLHVHDNQIDMGNGATGFAIVTITDTSYFTSRNNRFENNTYHVDQTGQTQWHWMDGPVDFSTWQSYGHDDTGSVQSP